MKRKLILMVSLIALVIASGIAFSSFAQQLTPDMMAQCHMTADCLKHCETMNKMGNVQRTPGNAAGFQPSSVTVRPAVPVRVSLLGRILGKISRNNTGTNMEMTNMEMSTPMCCRMNHQTTDTSTEAEQEGSVQTAIVQVTANGFEPSNIRLKPNLPAKLTFIRKTDKTCATNVVVREYNIQRDLPLHEPVEVEFTPGNTGEFAF